MDISSLERGRKVAAVAGLVLFLALFLSWYKSNGVSVDGWEALSVIDLILFVVAATAVAYALLDAADADAQVPPAVLTALAALAAVLILYRIASPPGAGDVGLGAGPFLAVISAVVMLYGGWLGMNEEGRGFANDPDRSPEDPGPVKDETDAV